MEIKLTRKQAISWHKRMWNDMADEIERYKQIVFVENFKSQYCRNHNFPPILNSCFLCAYTNCHCSQCPLQWDSAMKEYMCENKNEEWDGEGLWLKCVNAKTWQEQAALARQIANLPERKIGEMYNEKL